jgi:hypothetical protein
MPFTPEALRRMVNKRDAARELRRACVAGEIVMPNEIADTFELTAADLAADHEYAALRFAAKRGQTAVVIWLVDRFGLTAEAALACDNYTLRAACGYGHVGTARLLISRFGLPPDGVALQRACAGGHLAVAQLLVQMWGAGLDVHAGDGAALAAAAAGGHQSVVDWLMGECPKTLTAAGAMAALHCACCGGDLAAVQRIVRGSRLDVERLQARELVHSACECGHLEVAQWLAQFGWPGRHAPATLMAACAAGHLAVAQWLVATYMPAVDSTAVAEAAYLASGAGRLAILKWMTSTFGPLARDDAKRALGAAAGESRREVADWLTSQYDLPAMKVAERRRHRAQRARRAPRDDRPAGGPA